MQTAENSQIVRQFRPAWTPLNVGAMIFFFATGFWILGLAAIGYMVYGRRFGIDISEWVERGRGASRGVFGGQASGNMAFDEWRNAEIDRLEAERRKLDEERDAFEDYKRELRMAKDREEFERFRRNRGDAPTIDI